MKPESIFLRFASRAKKRKKYYGFLGSFTKFRYFKLKSIYLFILAYIGQLPFFWKVQLPMLTPETTLPSRLSLLTFQVSTSTNRSKLCSFIPDVFSAMARSHSRCLYRKMFGLSVEYHAYCIVSLNFEALDLVQRIKSAAPVDTLI